MFLERLYTYARLPSTHIAHLGALDEVYTGVISSHREAIEKTGDPDPITEDMLIDQSAGLEQFQWFVRAHLESADGTLATADASTEKTAARRATTKTTARSRRAG